MDMDLDQITRLIEFMNANNLVEIEWEHNGKRLKLRKAEGPNNPQVVVTPAAPVRHADSAASKAATAGIRDDHEEVAEGLVHISSPIVGTFYRAPSPDAEPFVDVGDEVDEDTVVCIVEAMKVMNEIKAELSGRIAEVLVGNGEAVEYGQPLFVIAPAE